MKQLHITFLLTLLMSMVGANSFAYDFEAKNEDGVTIYYNYINDGLELEVTYYVNNKDNINPNRYSGTVVIPEEVTYMGRTRKVTSIGEFAFRSCNELYSVTIPNSVTSIISNAFLRCTGLTSIILGNSVSSIGHEAFRECSNLISITIPPSVTFIDYHAFEGCTSLTEVHILDIASWCKIDFTSSSSNPLSYAHHLFLNGEEITDLVIPNSVTSIGGGAFFDCSGLTSVVIPNSVTRIGGSAFQGCSGLEKVIVEDIAAWCNISFGWSSNPLYYAHHLYSDENTEITDLVIPNSVTSIGDFAFEGCSGLTSVEIPNSVTSISRYAFSGCSGLTSIEIPNSVTGIGYDAFSGCSGLTSVMIPNSVTGIGSRAFSGCTGSLTINCNILDTNQENSPPFEGSSFSEVYIGNNVTTIGNYAFRNCSSIKTLSLPSSLTRIGNYAFSGCSGLTSVVIPNSVTSIGSVAFEGCSGLTSIEIPNSVTSIGWATFKNCIGLTSLTIPNSVTRIGDEAFSGCSGLTSVVIPNSVTRIGDEAFANVDLISVTSLIMDPFNLSNGAFNANTFYNATLKVPIGTKEKYKATEGWKKFLYIEEIDATGISSIDNGVLTIDNYYTIDGVRHEGKPTQKGVYIINGKKVIVK